jgi:hypothetical protein
MMTLKIHFEDEASYIITPKPNLERFTILKQYEETPIVISHIKNNIQRLIERVELNLFRYICRRKGNNVSIS